MAVVVAVIGDLLFGSRVQAALSATGHDVRLVGDPVRASGEVPSADVVVVDLTDARVDPAELLGMLRSQAGSERARALAFYSHVDVDTRRRALDAGFDVVVPRSRMARESPRLIAELLDGDSEPSP